MPTIGDAGQHSIFDDPSVERQARYVSAVLDVAKQHDALKQKRLKLESNYAAELERRAWLPLGAGGRALAGPMPDLQPHAWLPTELSELHRWIRQSAHELSEADACAPVVPSGTTDAELALEHAADGVRANALCPGDTFVERWALEGYMRGGSAASGPVTLAEAHADARHGGVPLARVASADEIARGALFLCCDDSSFMTGQTLVIDGGNTAR